MAQTSRQRVYFFIFNRRSWASDGTSRIATTEIALGRFVGFGQSENSSKGTGQCAEVTADTEFFTDQFGAILVGTDSIHWTGRHAPGFVALQTGVRCVTGFFIEYIDPYYALGGRKCSGLYPGTSQLALHAAGTFIRNNLETLGHANFPLLGDSLA